MWVTRRNCIQSEERLSHQRHSTCPCQTRTCWSKTCHCFSTWTVSQSTEYVKEQYTVFVPIKFLVPNTVWVKIKYPRVRKNIKNISRNFRIIFHLWHKIYLVVYHQCKYHQIWPFNFRDMTKFVRVPKISLVPTFPIHHVHYKHDTVYVAIPTVTYTNKTNFLYLFMM